MCSIPLKTEQLENLKNFKYDFTNDSIIYGYCLSPCLNRLVEYLPRNLAPNLITLFSLFCNIIAFTICVFDGGFDFDKELHRRTCFIIGFSQFLYQLLDNIDGKQARRTGNSSPFGMLMDHGCDVFTNIFTAYNLSRLLLVSNDFIYSFSLFIGLLVGFYMMTFEEYKTGKMYFPPINGADEGNFIVFLLGVSNGIFGQEWLRTIVWEKYYLTIGQLIGIIIAVGGSFSIFNLYLHTFQKKGFKEMIKIPLENMFFYNVIIIPIIYIFFREDFYFEYKFIILINACLLFARVTLDTQIKIVTMDNIGCNLMIIYSNLMLIISVFIINNYYDMVFLCCLAVSQFSELAIYIYYKANEITDYLNIKIFKINPVEQLV